MSLLRRLPKSDSGQALLIVLLGMTGILTVVLSVVSRTVTDITITSYQEDAQRAFDAAEAGIEDALLTGTAVVGPVPIGEATYDVSFANPVPDNREYKYPADLVSGESATFWFVEHDPANGKLTCAGGNCSGANRFGICWGSETTLTDETPAIEVTVLYDYNEGAGTVGNVISSGGKDFIHLKVARGAYDANTSGRSSPNNFDTASTGCNIAGKEFAFTTGTINLSGGSPDIDIPCSGIDECILMVKVRLFYNTDFEPLAIEVGPGSASLPPQGTQIDSVGAAGGSTRRINVFQSYPEPPFVFDSAIFGQGDLIK